MTKLFSLNDKIEALSKWFEEDVANLDLLNRWIESTMKVLDILDLMCGGKNEDKEGKGNSKSLG